MSLLGFRAPCETTPHTMEKQEIVFMAFGSGCIGWGDDTARYFGN